MHSFVRMSLPQPTVAQPAAPKPVAQALAVPAPAPAQPAVPLAVAPAAGEAQGRLGVKLLSWHAVASWTWNAGDDVCGICRTDFDGCPPDAKFPGDEAPVVWGVCNHAFHLPCITKWLADTPESQRCPICRAAWDFRA